MERPDLENIFTNILRARNAHELRGHIAECISASSMMEGGQQNISNTEDTSLGTQLPSASSSGPGPSAHNLPLPDAPWLTASAGTLDVSDIEIEDAPPGPGLPSLGQPSSLSGPGTLYIGTHFNMAGVGQPTTIRLAEVELDGELDRGFNDLNTYTALTYYHFILATPRARRRAIEQNAPFMLDLYRCILENRDIFQQEELEQQAG